MPSIFWDVTQRTLVVSYWHFRTAMLLKKGLVSCPEMSVYNYEQALCNISEERRPLHPLDLAMIQGWKQISGKNQFIFQYICTSWDTFYDVCQLLHVSATRCHPEEVIITKVYKQKCANLGSAPPYRIDWNLKMLKYVKFLNLIMVLCCWILNV